MTVLDHPGVGGAAGDGFLLGQRGRQQHHRLDVAPAPADVGQRHHRHTGLGGRKVEIPVRRAARDLEVDSALGQPVPRNQLLLDGGDLVHRHGAAQLQLAQRALERLMEPVVT